MTVLESDDFARFNLTPQKACAERMKRAEPDILAQAANHAIDALAHLCRRLVRERDCQDAVGRHAVCQEIGDATGEHLRLSRTGARHDEQRAVDMRDSFPLHGIQALKNIHCINLANISSIHV